MRFLALALLSISLGACAKTQVASERKVVPPPGTDDSSMPWNAPRQGEGAGMLGGLTEGR